MLSKDLALKARSAIAELSKEDRATPTEIWMAHYIEELTERAVRSRTLRDRRRAADKCAELIVHVWNKRVQAAAGRMKRALPGWLGASMKLRRWSEEVAAALRAPDDWPPPRSWDRRLEFLSELSEVEDAVIRLVAVGRSPAEDEDQDAAGDAIAILLQSAGVRASEVAELDEVFPEISELAKRPGPKGLAAARRALAVIHALRAQLI